MKLDRLKPEYVKILRRIQDSVPKEWIAKLTRKVPVAPTIKKAYERAVKDPEVNDELKRKAQLILDSGYLDKEVEVIDKRVENQINKYIDKEIEAAVIKGELPKGKKHRNLGKGIKKIIKAKK